MYDTVRAELFKLRRRPAAWVLLAAAAILSQVFGYLVPYLAYATGDADSAALEGSPEAQLASTLPDQLLINTIGGFPVFAGALALVLGALVFGGEYGWGTVKTMLTQRPGRGSVLAGQLVALGAALVVAVAVLTALSALSAAGIALAEDQPMQWPGAAELAGGLAAGWLVLMTWATLGAALGVTLRSVALPIGLGVVWVLGVENLVEAMSSSALTALQPVRDVLPGINAGSLVAAVVPEAMTEAPPGVAATVSEPRALLTLVAYVAVGTVVTVWAARRRDVV